MIRHAAADALGIPRRAWEYLAGFDPAFFDGKAPGFTEKTAIAGTSIFAIHQVYETKPLSQARFEAHRRHIDLQVVWRGKERVFVAPPEGLSVLVPYDSRKDVGFFALRKTRMLVLKPGVVLVFFPSDAHAPCISPGRRRVVVAKTVVKVRI